MKHITLFILLFWSAFTFAQKSAVLRIDSLPKQGIVLDKGWKWHAGDNPEWAKAEFDDSNWEKIDPTKDINDLPEVSNAGRGWFRIHLKINPSLSNTIVSMVIDQAIASAIYHEGHLIGNFGKIDSVPHEIKAYNPFSGQQSKQVLHVYTGNKKEQVLAIRFAIQPNLHYKKFYGWGNPCFFISLFKTDPPNHYHSNVYDFEKRGEFYLGDNLDYIKFGLFFIMGLLHFFYYFSYPAQKANLYFGLYCWLGDAMYLYQPITNQYLHFLSDKILYRNFHWFAIELSSFFLLMAVYRLFNYPKGIIFKAITIFIILFLIAVSINYDIPSYIGLLTTVLASTDAARVSVIAYLNKKEGALMLIIGNLIWAIGMILYIYTLPSNPYLGISLINHLVVNLAVVSVPISITLFLAREFTQTSKALAQRLKDVEVLAAEKQQILASQNETLERQVTERTAALNQSLGTLQSTQAQLIQSEKLASLGELTAGIAHEIQNPLNFVNNFAEVSAEMLDEMHEELEKGDTTEAIAIATDLKTNLEKINHHGQRASSIVKGMLEHSRASTGVKEPTDLNALADEYLRLAYHGLRAKDNNFNATMETHLDPDLPLVSVIPQDIGRVLLNLINNAFYAVNQRATTVGVPLAGAPIADTQPTGARKGHPYEPTVTVSTKKLENGIEISIQDNGNGIPDSIKDKIFQPFFTTKPTGQGTGLGLSLAYNIVTKGHGGNLAVESTPGDGTSFVIQFPINEANL